MGQQQNTEMFSSANGVNRPLLETQYDNLSQALGEGRYDDDGVTVSHYSDELPTNHEP